jgi:hypothetical protein
MNMGSLIPLLKVIAPNLRGALSFKSSFGFCPDV